MEIDANTLTNMVESRPVWVTYFPTKAFIRISVKDVKRWQQDHISHFRILEESPFGIYIEDPYARKKTSN